MMRDDTIFAVATGRGPAGIAVIRVSGTAAAAALERLTGRNRFPPRQAVRALFRDSHGEPLDDGLVLWFPAPASFTGEDVAELHVHGGRAVVADVLSALAAADGLRPADPGEYARRAFENGKLDLTAAEAIADLVAAETAAQRRQALRQMQGGLSAIYDGWRDRLIRALAHLDAVIDFADEDLPGDPAAAARQELAALEREVAKHLADGRRGERLRDGVRIAVIGPPNAGKSSLVNSLTQRDVAIVSESPGTTRDVIEVHLDLAGYLVTVADTAGLREPEDAVEREGVRRSRRAAAEADVRLLVFDGAEWPDVDGTTAALIDDDAVIVVNKSDLERAPKAPRVAGRSVISVSAKTGDGIDGLLQVLTRGVAERFGLREDPAPTRQRHRHALETCVAALARAQGAGAMELMAEDARLAARALGRITGRVEVEDLLDVIFRDFCIGK
jgi:tRNA modification GTPase